MSEQGLHQLATLLEARGLVVTPIAYSALHVTNPVSRVLHEVVLEEEGRYLTVWGYGIGPVGKESSAADRVAFLLGVPNEARQ